MATTPTAIGPLPPGVDPADPFRYGWRYLRRARPDGQEEFVQVPLTLEDVLHPQEGDYIVQNDPHHRWCVYLYNVFRVLLARVAGAVVLGDCRIAWDVTPPLWHGPDIAVIFNVRERKPWSTFDVAEEGTRLALIVEVTSPETAQLDLGNKVEEYAAVGVPLYAIVEVRRRRGKLMVRLLGYTLVDGQYEPLTTDGLGRLWLEPVGCWLAFADDELVCYDADGRPLGDSPALDAARRRADERAAAEAAARQAAEARANNAEARMRELEAELVRLRGGQASRD